MISDLPAGPYSVIYADCPWSYNDKAHAGQRGVEYKYGVLTDDDIISMPVKDIAADNAALFLWCTAPRMPIAFEVMRAWDFEYKTVGFTWIKLSRNGRPAWGMGNYTRANAEFCLLGIRGKPKRISAGVHSVVLSERRAHSQKPDEVRHRIVELFGEVPRIELFARGELPYGWTGWGDQYDA